MSRSWIAALGLAEDEFQPRGLCSLGGGSPSGNTTTTQTNQPWSGEQSSLLDIYSQAANNYNQEQAGGNLQYYPGQTYAQLTPEQGGLIGETENLGANGGTPTLNAAQGAATSLLSPSYTNQTSGAFGQGQGVLSSELNPAFLNPMSNPGEQSVINNTLAQVVPQLSSSFTSGNRSDSGLANQAISQGATNAVGGLLQQQYNTNVQTQNTAEQEAANNFLTQQGNQVKGMSVAPLIDQSSMADLQSGLTAAGMTQSDVQNAINASMQQYNYGQMLPYNALSMFENAVTGTGNPGGTTSTQQPYFSNTGAQVASGISSAATVAAMIAALA